jgi:hypothetical protein
MGSTNSSGAFSRVIRAIFYVRANNQIMNHAYPKDFAVFVEDRLLNSPGTFEQLWCKENLTTLFSVAYQASLLREEERALVFRLALALPEAFTSRQASALVSYAPFVPEYNPHTIRFESLRDLDEGELRRLAPAAKFHRSLIGVCADAQGKLKIWGIVHTGPAWIRALQGGGGAPYFPSVFALSVSGPGRLVASKEGRSIAKLSGGQITCDTPDVFASHWLPEAFLEIRREVWDLHLQRRANAGFSGSGVDPDVIRAVGQQFIRRIISIVRLAHHGGALIIAPPALLASQGFLRRLRVKYSLADDEPRRRFRSLMLSILDELARRQPARPGGKVGWREYNEHIAPGLASLDAAIVELSNFVAALAEVDGAVVLTQRFEVFGFGAEIAGDLPEVSQVARAVDLEGVERSFEPTDGVGTRHRSMYRLCSAFPGVIGVVISQDGGVRFVKWHQEALTYWDQVAVSALDI